MEMDDIANGAQTDANDNEKQDLSNVLNRLGSLRERTKNKTYTQPAQVAQQVIAPPEQVLKKESVVEQEIIPEVSAERQVDKSNIDKAKVLAEQVIPDAPLRLKGVTNFTPDNMYDQVRNDYMGIIHQSINGALDNLAAFYIQGKRFEAAKDMKIFLMKALERNIQNLKNQYIEKYPLINGLQSVISQVERTEADSFKRVVQDFLNRMVGNTFS